MWDGAAGRRTRAASGAMPGVSGGATATAATTGSACCCAISVTNPSWPQGAGSGESPWWQLDFTGRGTEQGTTEQTAKHCAATSRNTVRPNIALRLPMLLNPSIIEHMKLAVRACLSLGLLGSGILFAQGNPAWREPFEPHKIVDNIYYVGTKGLSTYLITTPQGHIVVNPSFDWTVPMIKASIEKLGFKMTDVKILLISHAHSDHCGGAAAFKELTGARYMVMQQDVPEIEAGGKGNFNNPERASYAPLKVDRVLKDGDKVELGGFSMTARLTPGHTRGCTTWTMKAREGGKTYDVVILGSPNVNAGYKLVNNQYYPTIAQDFEKMFGILKKLPCDIPLGAHGDYYNMEAKYAKLKAGEPNPFIDPSGWKAYIAGKEQAFRDNLAKQKQQQ
jgi:metallo-beta-lactamase class B